ncbi:MAG: ATP-grasp domain-containing protein [Chloroflexi bacterium]|nr:ATP-grasp domain-containing protein [Chloroflexota bacterium]
MRPKVAVVYSEPVSSRYSLLGEQKAVTGVLEAVDAVCRALPELGYDAARVPLLPPVGEVRRALKAAGAGLVFNLFEGFCGFPETEALLPRVCAELGLPCTGCPHHALALSLDKARMKDLLKQQGIPTPDYQLLKPGTVAGFRLAFPCIVKPETEDGSHGLTTDSVVHDLEALKKQVALVSSAYGEQALVEEFIGGREVNVTILGNRALPVSEIIYNLPEDAPRILTFAAKWSPGSPYYEATKPVCPAVFADGEAGLVQAMAARVYRLAGCRGYARVDMRYDAAGKLYVLELNPNPDISPESGAVRQAAAGGLSYARFIDEIVRLALEA